jgi:hypothetical protein
MKTETIDGIELTYDDSPEAKERVFQIMLEEFKKLRQFCGEGIHQSDRTYEAAPEILTRIAEEGFQFNAEYL